jgi:hypothetical protein
MDQQEFYKVGSRRQNAKFQTIVAPTKMRYRQGKDHRPAAVLPGDI